MVKNLSFKLTVKLQAPFPYTKLKGLNSKLRHEYMWTSMNQNVAVINVFLPEKEANLYTYRIPEERIF